MTTPDFYDTYHLQNDRFSKVISKNNFTYFYTLQTLHEACFWASKNGNRQQSKQNQKIYKRATPQVTTQTTSQAKLRILDVGCGVGTLSLYLATQGHEVVGYDLSPRAIKLAQQAQQQIGLGTVSFFQGEVKPGSGQFDLAICSEVIEHIPDDEGFLDILVSNLKPEGVLLLTTPSTQNLLYKLGFYTRFDQRVGHLRRYTPEKITKLIHRHGMRVVSSRTVEGPLRNLLFTTPLGIMIKGIRGPLIPLFHVFDRWSAMLFGAADIQVLARKVTTR